jgi:hypothetical protein
MIYDGKDWKLKYINFGLLGNTKKNLKGIKKSL